MDPDKAGLRTLESPPGLWEPCSGSKGLQWILLSWREGLARSKGQIDHLVVLRESGRPFRREDIEGVLGIALVAEVAVTARVAGLATQGYLPHGSKSLDELFPNSSPGLQNHGRI
jgi:hypothetical protein